MREGSSSERDYSFVLAQRTFDLMRDYGPSAGPRAYAVWYAYVAGTVPLMNDAIKRLTAEKGNLSEADVDSLYTTYIDPRRLAAEADRVNASLIAEVETIMETLDLSLGSAAQYGETLRAMSQDLAGAALNRLRMREIVAALIANTRDVAANNRTLELRMRESRSEIEDLHETLAAARLETLTDPLTGLGNRRCLEDALRQEFDTAPAGRARGSLIVLDIDAFKRFNDVYGHLTGDQVLRLVAIVMREHVGVPRATLARFGGEEFGIMLPEIGRARARAIAEKVRTSMMGRDLVKRSTGESLGKVTVSLGVAEHRPGDTAVSLLERADTCLFVAKRGGRNRTVDDTEASGLSDVA